MKKKKKHFMLLIEARARVLLALKNLQFKIVGIEKPFRQWHPNVAPFFLCSTAPAPCLSVSDPLKINDFSTRPLRK